MIKDWNFFIKLTLDFLVVAFERFSIVIDDDFYCTVEKLIFCSSCYNNHFQERIFTFTVELENYIAEF
jgi:hypothetical protein